jgi:RHS repeat-associated protein
VTYDGNGNPSEYISPWNGTVPLTYDAENRIAKAVDGSTTCTYTYDGNGLLAATGTSTGGSSLFLLSDLYGRPVIEFNSNGSIAAANTFGRDGLVGRYTANQSVPQAFYAYDMQGDTVQHILSNGTVDNWIRYLSAGQGRVSTLNTYGANIETYSNYGAQWGYRNDPGTSMEVTGQRFYDFNDARFYTRDPISYDGGMDLYQYADANPVNYSDPSGLDGTMALPGYWPLLPPSTFVLRLGAFGTIIGGGYAIYDLYNYGTTGQTGILTNLGTSIGSTLFPPLQGLPPSTILTATGSTGGPGAGKPFTGKVKSGVWARNPSRTCEICGMPGTATHVDHIVPRCKGGDNTPGNAQGLCPHCNLSKGGRQFPVTPPPGYPGKTWPP